VVWDPDSGCEMCGEADGHLGGSGGSCQDFCSSLLWAPAAHAATDHIRVLLLDGESGGPYHNWELTTPILKQELEETGLFDVTVATAPHADGDFTNFKPQFGSY
jgi:hypothetical protein